MINCNLSKLSIVWNLNDEKNTLITESVIVMNTKEMFSLLCLINSSVTTGQSCYY